MSVRFFIFFFFNDTATTEIYTLSLHDALPIYRDRDRTSPLVRRRVARGIEVLSDGAGRRGPSLHLCDHAHRGLPCPCPCPLPCVPLPVQRPRERTRRGRCPRPALELAGTGAGTGGPTPPGGKGGVEDRTR